MLYFIMGLIPVLCIAYWLYREFYNPHLKEKVEKGIKEYEKVFENLSEAEMKDIVRVMMTGIINNPAFDDVTEVPLESYMLVNGLANAKNKENRQIIDNAEIRNAVDQFVFTINNIVAVHCNVINDAASKGLGFGVITNSATSAALYSAMDVHERNKNTLTASRETRDSIKNTILILKNEIESQKLKANL